MKMIPAAAILIFLAVAGCHRQGCVDEPGTLEPLKTDYPFLADTILGHVAAVGLENGAIICVDGNSYTIEDLAGLLRMEDITEPSPEDIRRWIEELLLLRLFKGLPKEERKTETLSAREAVYRYYTRDVEIDDRELEDYFNRNFSWFSEPFEQVKDQIRDFVLRDKKIRTFDRFLVEEADKRIIVVDETSVPVFQGVLYDVLLNGRPSIVVFSSGCCMEDPMADDILLLQASLSEDVNIVHIESKIEYQVTDFFTVRDNPTTLIFDKEEYPVTRLPYYHSADEIERIFLESGFSRDQ